MSPWSLNVLLSDDIGLGGDLPPNPSHAAVCKKPCRCRRGPRRADKAEMSALKTRYSAAIDAAVSQARAMQERVTVETQDGGEAYAYPHQRGIAWGVEA